MWTDGALVSFDTETDGPNPETAHIVTASVVVIDGTTGVVDKAEWLVAVEHDIPAEATAVHGITTEYAREHGEPAAVVVGHIADVIEQHVIDWRLPLIVYNAPYDLTLLDRELRRHYKTASGIDVTDMRVVDPLVIDRALNKYRKGSRKLIDVSKHYGVPIDEADAHGSTADALCAARVAWKIGRLYPDACEDLDTMQVRQKAWHREWADHFAEYLRSKGKDASDVSGDWPYRPLPVGVNS